VTGAIFGGIGGGIQGYSLAKSIGHNPWTGSAPKFNYEPQRTNLQVFKNNFSSRRQLAIDPLTPPPTGRSHLRFDGENLFWYDEYYDRSSRLRFSTPAVSGSRSGNNSLPSGTYNASNYRLRTLESMTRHDVGFSVNLTPNFQTHRTLLRIHPDGNVYGTLGCIGLRFDNTIDGQNIAHAFSTYLSTFDSIHLNVNY
jgi:hypothetical protein